jgi:hypothetical protein
VVAAIDKIPNFSSLLVLHELDALYRFGYRTVFLADDNFTVYRARAKELLAAIQEWNARQTDGRVRFTTQISIDAAGDTEMLEMCADAGLTHVFIGIETPNEVSLREAKKRQNLKRNLLDEIKQIVNYGISVDCGMIVGFDNDEVDIFRRQYEFAMATAVPIFSLGALVAPAATPLHARLAKAGRLVEDGAEIAATPWSTNVIPAKMTLQELFEGIRRLCNSIYHPAAFEQQMSKLVDTLGSTRVLLFARQETQVCQAARRRHPHAAADPAPRARRRKNVPQHHQEAAGQSPGRERGAGLHAPILSGSPHVRALPVLGPDLGSGCRSDVAPAADWCGRALGRSGDRLAVARAAAAHRPTYRSRDDAAPFARTTRAAV